jgi:hypothetical protein
LRRFSIRLSVGATLDQRVRRSTAGTTRTERPLHRFNMAEKERDLALALRELAEVCLEFARHDQSEGFARAPSPSG